ncbi:MAG: GH1 family beta-glucosidase [Rectinemataceae bacterium]
MQDESAQRFDGFPADFVWGCSTASYQIEGSTVADGRGVSIWDTFSRTPGMVYGGMTGDLACDSYRKWKDDIALLKALGVGSYRYSIAWPRVQPKGSGKPLQAGLDYYKRLADGLAEEGIESAVTVYHWDLPQALEDAGGWPLRDTALRFAEYADIVYRELGDRVGKWFTLNEPWCSAFLGYELGVHAPGVRNKAVAYQAAHHLLLAHGLAVKAYRATGLKAPIGIVLNTMTPRPATLKVADVEAADRAADKGTALWLDPIFGRGYPERHLDAQGVVLPVLGGDLEIIASPIDFVGINYYSEGVVAAEASEPEGFREAPTWQDKTEMGWDIVPEGLYRMIMTISKRWPVKELYITENGAAFVDEIDGAGRIRDGERIAYLRSHIGACRRACAEGAPLKGYYLWSLMDNFEWSQGYSKRFGLVHVDPATGSRKPKDSYYFYRDIVAGNEL